MALQRNPGTANDRRGRVVAVVIAVAAIAALIAPWLVTQFGLPMRYEFLIYFGALAAFVWALFNTYTMWRARHASKD